jgi:hypothetical protein
MELPGTNTCGRNLTISPTLVGDGVDITANNARTFISSIGINGASDAGLLSAGPQVFATDVHVTNSGASEDSATPFGLYANCAAGACSLVVSGGEASNVGGNTTETIGAFADDGRNLTLTGTTLIGNTTAPFSATANASLISAVNTLPFEANNLIPGGVSLGGSGIAPAGTGSLNAASGVFNNDIAVNAYDPSGVFVGTCPGALAANVSSVFADAGFSGCTLTLPASPQNFQLFTLTAGPAVTLSTLTLAAPAGTMINGTVTSMTGPLSHTWKYFSGVTTWEQIN